MPRERTCEKRNKKLTKMTEQEMSGILRKIDLEGLVESFYEEDIIPDIACKFTIEDFEKLGLKDRSLIMKLRIECSTFGSFSPPKGYKTNKF